MTDGPPPSRVATPGDPNHTGLDLSLIEFAQTGVGLTMSTAGDAAADEDGTETPTTDVTASVPIATQATRPRRRQVVVTKIPQSNDRLPIGGSQVKISIRPGVVYPPFELGPNAA
jgi:hypothetical protein